jgi:hypothetical protein
VADHRPCPNKGNHRGIAPTKKADNKIKPEKVSLLSHSFPAKHLLDDYLHVITLLYIFPLENPNKLRSKAHYPSTDRHMKLI